MRTVVTVSARKTINMYYIVGFSDHGAVVHLAPGLAERSHRMIEKCPHCKRDVIFSRNICPACGHTSDDAERGEPTYMGDDAKRGLSPAYTQAMETAMNETQRRGRLLTGLIIGLILAPLVVLNAVLIFWLKPDFAALVALAFAAWLLRKLWTGRTWAKQLTILGSTLSGVAGLALCVVRRDTLNPVFFLMFLIFGVVYLWGAWNLYWSKDIPEFLKMQRRVHDEP
jgi:hypothetical protein